MEERRASLFDEGTSGIREFDNPSCVASEQVKSMLCFEVGDLFAERRLEMTKLNSYPRSCISVGHAASILAAIGAGKSECHPPEPAARTNERSLRDPFISEYFDHGFFTAEGLIASLRGRTVERGSRSCD